MELPNPLNRWTGEPITPWPGEPMTRFPDHPIIRSSMFWRLWWRAVSVQRSQAALALGSLMVGAAIASMLLNLYGDVRRKMTEDFRSYGANVVIAPASTGSSTGAEGNTMVEESSSSPLRASCARPQVDLWHPFFTAWFECRPILPTPDCRSLPMWWRPGRSSER